MSKQCIYDWPVDDRLGPAVSADRALSHYWPR
jgi:hypothetical protein